MILKKSPVEVTSWVLLAIGLGLSYYFYKHFPVLVPTHWNVSGEVDGYSSTAFAAFFFPVFNLVMYFFLSFVPYIDPERKRYQEFGQVYAIFKLLITAFLTILYFLIALNALGFAINVAFTIPLLIGFLILVLGNYLGDVKKNWFVGIRTPWTLSSERVWNKTHRLAGKLFQIGGLGMIALVFVPRHATFPILIIIAAVIALVPVIYSYFIYRKQV